MKFSVVIGVIKSPLKRQMQSPAYEYAYPGMLNLEGFVYLRVSIY